MQGSGSGSESSLGFSCCVGREAQGEKILELGAEWVPVGGEVNTEDFMVETGRITWLRFSGYI